MTIAIDGIGLATAQGIVSELPWKPDDWYVSRVCFPAVGIDSSLTGAARWRALAKKALEGFDKAPLLVASCNGGADVWEEAFDTSVLLAGTPWADDCLPVFSSSCASGIHALYAARQLLMSGAVDEVLVLAVDILARSNHENFESLRVLAERVSAPWQSTSSGFVLGEAAVVLRVVRGTGEVLLHGPALGSDLSEHDGLRRVLEEIEPREAGLILGQGTGPFANDAAELAAFAAVVDRGVPITTPLTHFGHTLGASGLLAVALGALTTNCRALNGACGATLVGGEDHEMREHVKEGWKKPAVPGPLMNETLKQLAREAIDHRPLDPPDVLLLRMDKPLTPQRSAIIGGRLLPSAVLEITPGFASQLIARCWGFTGPALCLVGDITKDPYGLTSVLNAYQVNLGDKRGIEWNV